MKKWLFAFLLWSPLFALYMGNPAAPTVIDEGFFFSKENWFAVKVGYQRDWLFDRNMKVVARGSGRMDNFEALSDQGVLTFNIIDHIEVYGSAGATRFYAANRPTSGVRHEFQTYDQFTWGVGARGTFYEWKGLSFGLDATYQQAHPAIKWLTVNGTPVNPDAGSKLVYSEWQIGLGAAYQVDIFFPYLAVKYSNATGHFEYLPPGFLNEGRQFKLKNRRKFGLALGTTLSTGSRLAANVEVRLIDEQAITLAAELEF